VSPSNNSDSEGLERGLLQELADFISEGVVVFGDVRFDLLSSYL
jgi:hypothetical protein